MRSRKAFTLVELLVVIAIVALLMAILFPALERARKQARGVACQSQMHQWGGLFAAREAANGGRSQTWDNSDLPAWPWWGWWDPPPNSRPGPKPGPTTQGILCCPMATRSVEPVDGPDSYGGTFRAWWYPASSIPARGSYGVNWWSVHHVYMERQVDVDYWHRYGYVTELKSVVRVPVLLDSTCAGTTFDDPNSIPPLRDAIPSTPPSTGNNSCINRHNSYVNGLFLDWSVRRIGLKELWTLKWYARYNTAGRWTKAGGVQPEDWPDWMRGFKDY